MNQPAQRTRTIEPFYVMEVVKAAQRLADAGRSVLHMSIGEPDFSEGERQSGVPEGAAQSAPI